MFRKIKNKGKKLIESESEQEEEYNLHSLPKKRNRGISACKITEDVEKNEENGDALGKKFIKSKSQIEQIRKSHLEKYIKETLFTEPSEKTQKAEELSEDILLTIPDKYKTDNSRILEGSEKTLWQSGIVEVPLSIEHKLDNIEATEAAKRRAIKDYSYHVPRFEELHVEEYEQYNERLNDQKNNEKNVERLEKKMMMRGKKYKMDKSARVEQNKKLENSWKEYLKPK